jgi:nucleoside-diphosphate-sugar epimerase
MSFTANPDAISRAHDMNLNILETAKKHKTVQRVVLTSSSCAAFYPTVNGLATVDHGMSLATNALLYLLLSALFQIRGMNMLCRPH